MKEFTYENQGSNTYLVYTLAAGEQLDPVSLGMISNNTIPGFAPTIFTQMNSTKYIKYNVSSKISASQVFSGIVNRRSLLGIFRGIANTILTAEEYMIDISDIVMDLDYIFVDVSTYEVLMVCLPVSGKEQNNTDINKFFKDIMYSKQFDQRENCDYVTRIINYFNGDKMLSLAGFKELLDKMVSESAERKTERKKSAEEEMQKPQAVVNEPKPIIPVLEMPSVPEPPTPVQEPPKTEKQMSLLYLLRHYDRQNADRYKAQKAEKRAEKDSTPKTQKKEKRQKEKPAKSKNASRFAIPGQDSVPGAISNLENGNMPEQMLVNVKMANEQNSEYSQSSALSQTKPEQEIGGRANFGDTVFADNEDDNGGTIMMGYDSTKQEKRPHLIRKKNNEIIPICNDIFRLGRNSGYNDYVITENEYVGNSHCHILVQNGEYFIIDDNSKNHTFVDGKIISSGSQIKLTHGQSIRLADEEFEFRLY